MGTIFKKIIEKEIPADVVYEDELCLAFKDIQPQAPLHFVLIPKKEIESMAAVEAEDQALLGHLLLKASQIAREQSMAEAGYRLVINTKEYAGQTVFHLHVHILGGKQLSLLMA